MRISDWCVDVCSSDLLRERIASGDEFAVLVAHLDVELQPPAAVGPVFGADPRAWRDREPEPGRLEPARLEPALVAAAGNQPVGERAGENGRASCRERVCQYV